MKSVFIPIALACAVVSAARADYNPVPLTPGSFTQDIVIEKASPPPLANFCNATIDQGTNNYGNTFFEEGYIPNMPMFGLPAHGATFTANDNANIQYIMPPDYTTNCAAYVGSQNIPSTGVSNLQVAATTIYLTTPSTPSQLSFLYASGGGGPVNWTAHHQDGSSEQGSFTTVDWFNTTAACAWIAKGRVQLDGSAPLNTLNSSTQTKVMHTETLLGAIGTGSPVTSIDFAYPAGLGSGTYRAFVFGISGSTDGTTYTPIPIYGFNADCVVEANCPVKANYVNGCNVSFDGGPGNTGATVYEQGFATTNFADQGFNGAINGTLPLGGTYGPINSVNTNTGLPHAGATLTSGTHSFVMPSTYVGNCAVFVGNYAAGNVTNNGYGTPDYRSNTITFTTSQPLFGISFLDSSGGGTSTVLIRLNYSDGSFSAGKAITIGDWFGGGGVGNTQIWTCQGRVNTINPGLSSVGVTSAVKLYFEDITPDSTSKNIDGITFSWSAGNRPFIFGISGQTTSGGNFSPLAFTGFNADPVVEAAQPLFPGGVFSATTATMDLGLRNGNFTWFETGWVTNGTFATLGMPASGSTFDSLQSATRHFQLNAYNANNGILLDTNTHRSALITPQSFTQTNVYTAIAMLTAGASIGTGNIMSNDCVLFHADGSAETNLFRSYDWFDTTVAPAFITHGRADTRFGTAASLSVTGQQTPRLFESFFQLQNLNSPITNILVVARTNVIGGASWTTYVMGVSGTTNPVQPILANTVESINGAVPVAAIATYEGSNVVWNSSSPVAGTLPITYQWQYSADGTTWVNLSDVGFFTGSATASLTNSSVGYTNWGQYRLYACNAAGCTTNFPATLGVVSPIPDVTLPGDPVAAFQPNGGSSPANQGPDKAIDDLVGTNAVAGATYYKYLNFGQNGGAPFVGPIGLVVSPVKGKTTVSVLRIYTANDNQPRDPIDYGLEGSNDGGITWTPISGGSLSLPAARTTGATAAVPVDPIALYTMLQEVHFANGAGYFTYRLSFTNATDNVNANSIQVGEVELLGTNTPGSAIITQQPTPNIRVFRGGAPSFFVGAYAYPGPVAYQWYRDNGSGPVGIPGATSATYTLNNAQLTDSGAMFSCQVSNNIPPAVTSAISTLTVIPAPTFGYATNVMSDGPLAWLRLDEGPDDGTGGGNNGVTAYDLWGGHNGYYTNTILQQPEYSACDPDPGSAYFGQSGGSYISIAGVPDSCVEAINGIDFAATNASAALSVEAWVRGDPAIQAGGSIAGAGIVAKGYGGGGEQFNLDCGGGAVGAFAHTFRFFVRDTSGNTHGPASPNIGPEPGVWHHVVGVVDEANSNVVLYVDGLVNATGAVNPTNGILSSSYPVTIGSRAQSAVTNNNMVFEGDIDEVAIYNHALSSNQVMTHFLAAGIAPRFLAQPTNTTFSEGSTATFYAPYYGSPTLYAQWYQSTDGGVTWAPLGGKTSSPLVLPSVSVGMNGYQYYLQVTNNYCGGGATNSAIATLNVQAGPPVLDSDVSPASALVYAGRAFSIQTSFGGTLPITYQWFRNGSPVANNNRISGATSNILAVVNAQTNDTGTYYVQASNAYSGGSPTQSGNATVVVETIPDFNFTGLGWGFQANTNSTFMGFLGGDVLALTDGSGSEAASAFYNYPLYIGGFQAGFTYQATNLTGGGADGVAFVLQDDTRGAAALGGAGGALGLSGIHPSLAMTLNIFPTASGGAGMSFGQNGAQGLPYSPTTPLFLNSGDPINISALYNGAVLSIVMTDAVAQTSFTTNFTVNIPAILGTNIAYVGFTGGDGGSASSQNIYGFFFIPQPVLSAQLTHTNTVLLSWPASIGGYAVLQKSALLPAGGWSASPAVVNQLGSQYQAIVAPSGAEEFYRLVLEPTEP